MRDSRKALRTLTLAAFSAATGLVNLTAQAAGGEAPGAPGAAAHWGPSAKSFVGTAVDSASRVYFTGYRGIVSEVFYPVLDTADAVDLQFLVGDQGETFVDEEKLRRIVMNLLSNVAKFTSRGSVQLRARSLDAATAAARRAESAGEARGPAAPSYRSLSRARLRNGLPP